MLYALSKSWVELKKERRKRVKWEKLYKTFHFVMTKVFFLSLKNFSLKLGRQHHDRRKRLVLHGHWKLKIVNELSGKWKVSFLPPSPLNLSEQQTNFQTKFFPLSLSSHKAIKNETCAYIDVMIRKSRSMYMDETALIYKNVNHTLLFTCCALLLLFLYVDAKSKVMKLLFVTSAYFLATSFFLTVDDIVRKFHKYIEGKSLVTQLASHYSVIFLKYFFCF